MPLLLEQRIMASKTKYQPAPQRDSFDEPGYSQAPPSYQTASETTYQPGTPRDEDDNLPDDFKVYTPTLSLPLRLTNTLT